MKKKIIQLRSTPVNPKIFKSTKKQKKEFIKSVFKLIEERSKQAHNAWEEANKKQQIIISEQLEKHLQKIRDKSVCMIFVTQQSKQGMSQIVLHLCNEYNKLIKKEDDDYPHDKDKIQPSYKL